ncbi:hypothetical protein M0812_14306 [Anaeramoeba flamelloides]|uniref:Uncharacterized protein n=1 Tax=Anaeramoeba flamelloides TaxID=1746091 RepID=A0AAV7ZF33_9EUKA|nr:hypothetical protein M0812_14306 [Anaeramoeba flamelloides]
MDSNYEPILDPDYSDLFQDEFEHPLFDFESETTNNKNNSKNEKYDIHQLETDFEFKGEISQTKNKKTNNGKKNNSIDNFDGFLSNKDPNSNSLLFSQQETLTNNPILQKLPSLERFLTLDQGPSFERLLSFGRTSSFASQLSFSKDSSFQQSPLLDRIPSFGDSNNEQGNWLFSQKSINQANSTTKINNFSTLQNSFDHNLLTDDKPLVSISKIQENNKTNSNQSLTSKKKKSKTTICHPESNKKTSILSILSNNNKSSNSNNNNKNNHYNNSKNNNNKKYQLQQTSASFLDLVNHPTIELIVGSEFERDLDQKNQNENEKEKISERMNENGIQMNEKTPLLSRKSKMDHLKVATGEQKIEMPSMQYFEINNELFQGNFSKNLQNSKTSKLPKKLSEKNNQNLKMKKKKTRIRIKIGTRNKETISNNKTVSNNEKTQNKKIKRLKDLDDSRKRLLKLHSLNQNNSVVVESGKEVFKLLTGQLWVISGGASRKSIIKYTNKFVHKIGGLFKASELEEESFQTQLKYLLSNSRRTFTEFILEILVGVLSLKYSKNPPDITFKFWKILQDASQLNSPNQIQNVNQNFVKKNNCQDESTKEDENFKDGKEEKLKRKKTEQLNIQLEEIYQRIYTQKVLMHWFDKRFVERLSALFNGNVKKKFYEQHLYYLGKSKFILSCLLLAKELIKRENGLPEKYYNLINLDFNNNPLNLYLNNRGKKLNLVKNLINIYGLNNGSFWTIISKDYLSKMKFSEEDIFEFFPFKDLIQNPLLVKLCKRYSKENSLKKRNVSSNCLETGQVQINVDWLFKKRAI